MIPEYQLIFINLCEITCIIERSKTDADIVLIIEVVGKWTYIALSPIQEFSLAPYKEDEVFDDFTF